MKANISFGYGKGTIFVIIIILALSMIRFDWVAGSHRITPTAVDSDLWGNYKVYYKTSNFTQNREEDIYYIEKGRNDLIWQTQDAIRYNKEIIVYYDKYIDFGFWTPATSPIIKIEEISYQINKPI